MVEIDVHLWRRLIGREDPSGVVDPDRIGHGLVIGEGGPVKGRHEGIKVLSRGDRQAPKEDRCALKSYMIAVSFAFFFEMFVCKKRSVDSLPG